MKMKITSKFPSARKGVGRYKFDGQASSSEIVVREENKKVVLNLLKGRQRLHEEEEKNNEVEKMKRVRENEERRKRKHADKVHTMEEREVHRDPKCQMFIGKLKNVGSLAGMKEKLAEIQNTKKKKEEKNQEKLTSLGEQI